MAKRRLKGEGSVWFDQANGRWMAKITLPTGKKRSKSGKTKKEALDWLTEQRSKVKKGIWVEDEALLLGDFITSYMDDVARHNLRPRTFNTHKGYVNKHIVPELGRIKLASLRPDQVQAFYTKKLDQGLAPRTVQYMHSILRKTLQQALKWGMVSRNVCDLVEAPKPVRKAPELLSVSEIHRFLETVKGHRYYPIYVLAVYTGMRQSEILGLHVADIDLERGTLQVRRIVQYVRGQGFIIADVKTEKSKRLVELPETAALVLREHLKTVTGELVFTASTGNPVYNRNLYRHFKNTLVALKLPDVTFHSLRHFHASALLKAGIHPKVVQERLGHSQISTTLDIYSHTVPSLQKEAAAQFNKILDV